MQKRYYFKWQGIDKKGLRVQGIISGISAPAIQAELWHQGIELIVLKRKSFLFVNFKKRISKQDIVLICRHLSTLISGGIPLLRALDIIAQSQRKSSLQLLLQTIKHDISSGCTLHHALSKHKNYFNTLFRSLIYIGEESGTLENILKHLAQHMEKSEALKRSIRKAMYYPILIITISLLIATLLLIFIVPQFDTLFTSFGTQLPSFTRSVISFSQFLKTHWLTIGVFFIVKALLVKQVSSYPKFKQYRDLSLLKFPIFGKLIRNAIIARITRTLATTLSVGTPLLEALRATAIVADHYLFSDAVLKMKQHIATGRSMHIAMHLTQVFPLMVIQMVAVGEESGTLNSMLHKVASFYEEEVSNTANGLSTLIEPLVILILGVIIGSFVLAIYLPIFQIGAVL